MHQTRIFESLEQTNLIVYKIIWPVFSVRNITFPSRTFGYLGNCSIYPEDLIQAPREHSSLEWHMHNRNRKYLVLFSHNRFPQAYIERYLAYLVIGLFQFYVQNLRLHLNPWKEYVLVLLSYHSE